MHERLVKIVNFYDNHNFAHTPTLSSASLRLFYSYMYAVTGVCVVCKIECKINERSNKRHDFAYRQNDLNIFIAAGCKHLETDITLSH